MNLNDRITYNSAADANYLEIMLDESSELDNIAINMLSQDPPEYFLNVSIKDVNGRESLRYKLINAISLSNSVFHSTMQKAVFVKFALELLEPFIKCRDWLLDYHCICIDPRFILLNKRSGKYIFAYMPASSLASTDEEIIDFFNLTLTHVRIADDPNLQIRMFEYFRDGDVTLNELYNLLSEERRDGLVKESQPEYRAAETPRQIDTPVAPAPAPAPAPTAEPKEKGFSFGFGKKKGDSNASPAKAPAKPKASAEGEASDSFGDIFAGDENFDDLFGSKKPSKKTHEPRKSEPKAPAKPIFGFGLKASQSKPEPAKPAPAAPKVVPQAPINTTPAFSSEDGATMIGDDGFSPMLELIDSYFPNVPKRISLELTKPCIVLGRVSAEYPDVDVVFPPECKAVSRPHAKISVSRGRLTVTDLGSSYFTQLDGKRLTPNVDYPLEDGMILVLVEQKPIRYRVRLS